MAQRTLIQLIDDLDGSEADETVSFGLDGVEYTIDLSRGNADTLRAGLADFVEKARKPYGSRRRVAGKQVRQQRSDEGRPNGRLVRAWAQAQGHKLADRGRIPEEIYAEYAQAHQ